MPQESNTPLLNEYKLKYLYKIITQTFLGGIHLQFTLRPPWYVYSIQIILWLLPVLIGSISTIVMGTLNENQFIGSIVSGCTLFLTHLVIHASVFVSRSRLTKKESTLHNFLAEEDEITFETLFSLETLEFIFMKKRCTVNYVVHSFVSGVLLFSGIQMLQPNKMNAIFSSLTEIYTLIVFGWFAICIAAYPMICQPPKEVSTFYVNDILELRPIMRAIHVITVAVAVISISEGYNEGKSHTNILYSLYIILTLFPIFWAVGVLPPLDSMFAWGLEQCNIVLLGGTQMATLTRLATVSSITWIVIAVIYSIQNETVIVVISSICAIILSLDIATFTADTCKFIYAKTCSNNVTKINTAATKNSFHFSIEKFVLTIMLVILTGVVTGLTKIYKINGDAAIYMFTIFIICLLVLLRCLCNLQNIYLFNVLRNPFYHYFQENEFVVKLTWIVYSFVLPMALMFLITIVVSVDSIEHCCSFFYVVLLIRIYRMVWQSTFKCSCDIVLYVIVSWCSIDIDSWIQTAPYLKLFILSLVLRYLSSCLHKLWFIYILIYNSLKQPRYQLSKVYKSLVLCLITFPIVIFVVMAACILSVPLLPLFTLPIFIIASPKLSCLWPNTLSQYKSSQLDWVYYKHLDPLLVEELKTKVFALNILQSGNYFIGRFQDRLIWISVLESGLFYCNITVKGLELQETSCHTLEANLIDEIIEQTFITEKITLFNQNINTVVTPKSVCQLGTYSDARNTLTGVIDNNDFLQNVTDTFMKTLIWCLVTHCSKRPTPCSSHIEKDEDNLFNYQIKFNTRMTDLSCIDHENDSLIILPKNTATAAHEIVIVSENSSDQRLKADSSDIMMQKNVNQLNSDNEDDDDEFGNFGFNDESDSLSFDIPDTFGVDKVDPPPAISVINEQCIPVMIPLDWWKSLPFNEHELSHFNHFFPEDWYRNVMETLANEENTDVLQTDLNLLKQYKLFVLACYYLTEILGVKDNSAVKEGPSHVLRMFYGQLPWSPHASFIDSNKELKDIVVKAYRMAFKLAYDGIVLGDDTSDNKLLHDMIIECRDNWYIGEENDEEWMENVLQGKSNLLSMALNKQKNVYTSRTLTKQKLDISLLEINTECVLSIWSALSLELFYITNDDDERYSIQAMPGILRNILTQCADPPLGYPIYSSGVIHMSYF